ncbi:uncharacterized protein BO88DRAFT_386468 [Aspergillus vadensis CBS 113365]|uniref:Zn(II)2Cys6 transcription factor n=1 Tax=Aspergillus vadensis (strain CBS 113365 / IMI 142717 / IBT 24658) TaxID=1448311 RepID=A0A319BEJ1_ASPVC|nr:hypothetical protein BO88DRAFT_386468 [Aspergillus vadensis CBS 113365]PYH70444.1 hypothetical protein BO88DRAFT_386468 [Aspergillus vadensis CBS 113365]
MDQTTGFPTSTWDVFNNTSSPFGNAVPSTQPIPHSKSPSRPTLDTEKVALLQEYQNGVGTWVGLFDNARHLTHTIVKRALESPLLLNAICALTARQMSMVGRGEMWETTAVHYYGESLQQLIHILNDPSYGSDDTLAATVLLSSYELFASPGLDHHRHVSGAVTLIRTNSHNANSGGLKGAAFWVYARQDVAMALVHECPTMLLLEEWGVDWTDQEIDEDLLGNKIIWIVAKVIAHTFGKASGVTERSLRRDRMRLIEELETWRGSLPTSFAGLPFGTPSEEEFFKRLFAIPSTAAAMCMYHLAYLLLLTEGRNPSLAGEIPQEEVDTHARSVASIASSPISDASLVQAAQPLYYSAKHISTVAEKFKMWTLLGEIENRLGFHTGHRIKQLHQQFKLV